MYEYARPDDGYAYSPIELAGIMAIPVSIDDIAASREAIYQFHEHCQTPTDEAAMNLIWRDTMAQLHDPEPTGMTPTWADHASFDHNHGTCNWCNPDDGA